jgi:hypothetical protein
LSKVRVTVGYLQNELWTRINQRRLSLSDLVIDRLNEIYHDNSCGIDTGASFIRLPKPVIRSGGPPKPHTQAPLEQIDAESILKQY